MEFYLLDSEAGESFPPMWVGTAPHQALENSTFSTATLAAMLPLALDDVAVRVSMDRYRIGFGATGVSFRVGCAPGADCRTARGPFRVEGTVAADWVYTGLFRSMADGMRARVTISENEVRLDDLQIDRVFPSLTEDADERRLRLSGSFVASVNDDNQLRTALVLDRQPIDLNKLLDARVAGQNLPGGGAPSGPSKTLDEPFRELLGFGRAVLEPFTLVNGESLLDMHGVGGRLTVEEGFLPPSPLTDAIRASLAYLGLDATSEDGQQAQPLKHAAFSAEFDYERSVLRLRPFRISVLQPRRYQIGITLPFSFSVSLCLEGTANVAKGGGFTLEGLLLLPPDAAAQLRASRLNALARQALTVEDTTVIPITLGGGSDGVNMRIRISERTMRAIYRGQTLASAGGAEAMGLELVRSCGVTPGQ